MDWRLFLTICVLMLAWPGWSPATDKVRILHSDGDALQARVDLLQQAKREINVSYYIVGDDQVPLLFLSLLRDAARRGVTVKLLVDGHDGNNQMPRALQVHLLREGVAIREYHAPLRLNGYWIKNRMHDKLVIVDGEHLITGGRNLKDDYYGHACENFLDRDVYLRGCTAAAAQCYFLARWQSSNVEPTRLSGRVNQKSMQKEMTHVELNDACDEEAICIAGYLLDQAKATAESCGLARLDTNTDWSTDAHNAACVRFLHDDPDREKTKCPGIADDMLELFAGAQCEIVLETPYLVLSKEMKRIFASAAARGVHITILTNSLATTNHHSAHGAYENDKRWLLRHCIELWELTGEKHLHAKAAVVDRSVAIIGSYNFDMLSEKRNSEVAVAIHDQEIAGQLLGSIAVHLESCYRIDSNARPIGYDVKYPGASRELIKELHRKRLAAPVMRSNL